MSEHDRKFWMVWCPDKSQPRYRHDTERGAIAEAERLANAHPGERFYVLAAIAAREVNNMHRIELLDPDSELPF